MVRRRLFGRRKSDKKHHLGATTQLAGTEAASYDAVIARIQTVTEADELIGRLENELQKSKSPALRRRLQLAIEGTNIRKAQLLTTTGTEKKARPAKTLRELFTGRRDKIVDDRAPIISSITPVEPSDGDEPQNE